METVVSWEIGDFFAFHVFQRKFMKIADNERFFLQTI